MNKASIWALLVLIIS